MTHLAQSNIDAVKHTELLTVILLREVSHMQSCRVYEHLGKKNQFINLSNHQLVTNLQYWHCERLLILAAVYCVLYSALCTGLRNA